eukprot:11677329-Alexandrium_andersonii.AAC.1
MLAPARALDRARLQQGLPNADEAPLAAPVGDGNEAAELRSAQRRVAPAVSPASLVAPAWGGAPEQNENSAQS